MNKQHRRAYRILGIPPGSSKDAVKQAYRDLAQVWHPDRFQHNDRLNEKAERNLKRVNEAYALLKDYEPVDAPRASRFSMTMSAVMDLGDILETREIHRGPPSSGRPPKHHRHVVLGVGDFRSTAELRRHKSRANWKPVALIGVAILMAVLAYFII
jgi:DnaJ domain